MAHAWAQCHLVGISRMLVGVHGVVPGADAPTGWAEEVDVAYALTARPKRVLQELWLYDVEKMPNAVKVSSDEDGFRVRHGKRFSSQNYFVYKRFLGVDPHRPQVEVIHGVAADSGPSAAF